MKRPFGLPQEFVPLCEEAKDGKELYQKVLELSDEKIYEFFYCAADDHTWIREYGGGDYVGPMLEWFTKKYRKRAYPRELAVKVVRSCRENFEAIKPYLAKDIVFYVEGKAFRCNSLIFSIVGGEFFKSVEDETDLPFSLKEVFERIREYIYTGEIKDFWKEEPKMIYDVIEQANKWNLEELSDFGFKTYKNYIEKETLMKRLVFALEDRLPALTREMCEVVNKEHMGFILNFTRFDYFAMELQRVWDEYQPFLFAIVPYITHLKCNELTDNYEVLLRCNFKELHHLDFSGSEKTDKLIKVLEGFHNIYSCNLTDLEWMDDAALKEIVDRLPSLQNLDLTRVSHLTYQGYAEFAGLKNLDTLSLKYHVRMSDDDLGIVLETLPQLRILDLSYCQKLTDTVLTVELQRLEHLEELTLSHCQGFSVTALHALKGLRNLRRVTLHETKGVDEKFARELKSNSPVLQEVIL